MYTIYKRTGRIRLDLSEPPPPASNRHSGMEEEKEETKGKHKGECWLVPLERVLSLSSPPPWSQKG